MEMLTKKELVSLLGVGSSTIARWVKEGKMAFPKPIKVNRNQYWDPDKIIKWLESKDGKLYAEKAKYRHYVYIDPLLLFESDASKLNAMHDPLCRLSDLFYHNGNIKYDREYTVNAIKELNSNTSCRYGVFGNEHAILGTFDKRLVKFFSCCTSIAFSNTKYVLMGKSAIIAKSKQFDLKYWSSVLGIDIVGTLPACVSNTVVSKDLSERIHRLNQPLLLVKFGSSISYANAHGGRENANLHLLQNENTYLEGICSIHESNDLLLVVR